MLYDNFKQNQKAKKVKFGNNFNRENSKWPKAYNKQLTDKLSLHRPFTQEKNRQSLVYLRRAQLQDWGARVARSLVYSTISAWLLWKLKSLQEYLGIKWPASQITQAVLWGFTHRVDDRAEYRGVDTTKGTHGGGQRTKQVLPPPSTNYWYSSMNTATKEEFMSPD